MQVVNGFIKVDTANTSGALLETKCGILRTNNKQLSFEIYNNFSETIFCTTIINGKIDRRQISPDDMHIIQFGSEETEIRIYFGLPHEGNEYSYTSLWGDNFGGSANTLGLFFMVNSNEVKVNSLA